jgi:hypothetical protein
MNRDQHKEQQGYFTFALNTDKVDYLNLAYVQALSIKKTQKINSYAVAVDEKTFELLEDKHKEVFDYVIKMDNTNENEDPEWKLGNEWKAYFLTPFKETVKLDSDITFNRNIDHWWNVYQLKDMLFTTEVVDYKNEVSDCKSYRKLFLDNKLPNFYSGFMYFRYTQMAADFFQLCKVLYHNWDTVKNEILLNCRDEYPTTDVVFALSAKIMGEEQFYVPGLILPRFAHMKGAIQGWGLDEDWTSKVYSQIDDKGNHTIGFHRQLYPVHYVQKHYITEEVVRKYE